MAKVALLPWGDVIEDYLDTIGLTVQDFAERMSGGWLFGYADALRRVGVESCIICVSRSTRRVLRLMNPATGLACIVLPAPRAALALRRVSRLDALAGRLVTPKSLLADTFRAEGVTHVICQDYEYHRARAALLAAKSAGIRVHASFQGGIPGASECERQTRGKTIRALDGLIIASASEAARVIRDHGVPMERIASVPNPLDTDDWRPADRSAARRAAGLPEDATIAICHTRIDVRRKGLDVMIEAWRRVCAAHPDRDLRLHIIGTGEGKADFMKLITEATVPGLRWTGYTTDRDAMRTELAVADFYLSASRNEGFAVAPLEAMACGLPVILSTAPGSAEILPCGEADGGHVVPAGDIGALTDAICRLLNDPSSRARMAVSARARAEAFVALPSVGRQLARALDIPIEPHR